VPEKGKIDLSCVSTVGYFLSAASLGSFGRLTFTFWPLAYNLHDLSDIGTFTLLATKVECISVDTIPGAFLGIRFALCKYRALIKVLEKARRDSDGRLATQMIEKKVTQFKFTEINLVANEFELTVCQKIFAGIPGIFTAGAFFKNQHISPISSCKPDKSEYYYSEKLNSCGCQTV
jgi:hypothetical protein